ncbi:leucine-rich repeat domain-containing protein [Pararobbsia silviterrae]|uniref:leucine-rich repeat domain-containing protein n=1 Tax=Pararobbsia silviterrae TaxID=1792498 RepID=UPI0011C45F5B|nr:leucine-rich repeat domain-containing protein [Pararobbsia silviterrae]
MHPNPAESEIARRDRDRDSAPHGFGVSRVTRVSDAARGESPIAVRSGAPMPSIDEVMRTHGTRVQWDVPDVAESQFEPRLRLTALGALMSVVAHAGPRLAWCADDVVDTQEVQDGLVHVQGTETDEGAASVRFVGPRSHGTRHAEVNPRYRREARIADARREAQRVCVHGDAQAEQADRGMREFGDVLASHVLPSNAAYRKGPPVAALLELQRVMTATDAESICARIDIARGIAQALDPAQARASDDIDPTTRHKLVSDVLEMAVFGRVAASPLELANGALRDAARARLTVGKTRELVQKRVLGRIGARSELAQWITRVTLEQRQPLLLRDACASVVIGSPQWVDLQIGFDLMRARGTLTDETTNARLVSLARSVDAAVRRGDRHGGDAPVAPHVAMLYAIYAQGGKAKAVVSRDAASALLVKMIDARRRADRGVVRDRRDDGRHDVRHEGRHEGRHRIDETHARASARSPRGEAAVLDLAGALKRFEVAAPAGYVEGVAELPGILQVEGKHYLSVQGRFYFVKRNAGRWSVCIEHEPSKPGVPIRFDTATQRWRLDATRGLPGGMERAPLAAEAPERAAMREWAIERHVDFAQYAEIDRQIVARTPTLDLRCVGIVDMPAFVDACPWVQTLVVSPAHMDEFIVGVVGTARIKTLRIVDGQSSMIQVVPRGLGIGGGAIVIPGSLDALEIEGAGRLTFVHLSERRIHTLRVRHAPGLAYIRASACALARVDIDGADRLSRLELVDNALSAESFETLVAPRLRTLTLDRNRIERVPDVFARCPRLQTVSLASNLLGTLDSVAPLEGLTYLNASHNALSAIPERFASAATLRTFLLAGNAIRVVDDAIQAFSRLESLDLSDNIIERISDRIQDCAGLRTLELDANPLRSVPAAIQFLHRLSKLSMRDCGLDALPRFVGALDALRTLRLAENPFGGVPAVLREASGFIALTELDLAKTGLTRIEKGLGYRVGLAKLDLSNNVALDTLAADIATLKQLGTLNLSRCGFRHIPAALGEMNSGTCVTMYDNPLPSLIFRNARIWPLRGGAMIVVAGPELGYTLPGDVAP